MIADLDATTGHEKNNPPTVVRGLVCSSFIQKLVIIDSNQLALSQLSVLLADNHLEGYDLGTYTVLIGPVNSTSQIVHRDPFSPSPW
jgi:hypothetical protein